MRASIEVGQPFDRDWLLAFLRARQASAIETIGENRITRAVRVAGQPAILEVTLASARITAECTAPISSHALRSMVTRMLDLDADVIAFARHVERDRVLGRLVRARPGLRVPQFLDPFECVVRAMLGQQVTVRAATTLANRVAVAFGDAADGLQPMPDAERLAAAGPERLQQLGIMPARARALHAIAVAIAEKRIDLDELRSVPGEQAQAALDALPGIGPATARAILEERARRGGFRSTRDLLRVAGIGEGRFARLKDLVRV